MRCKSAIFVTHWLRNYTKVTSINKWKDAGRNTVVYSRAALQSDCTAWEPAYLRSTTSAVTLSVLPRIMASAHSSLADVRKDLPAASRTKRDTSWLCITSYRVKQNSRVNSSHLDHMQVLLHYTQSYYWEKRREEKKGENKDGILYPKSVRC